MIIFSSSSFHLLEIRCDSPIEVSKPYRIYGIVLLKTMKAMPFASFVKRIILLNPHHVLGYWVCDATHLFAAVERFRTV
jgi:hypothetical protein